LNVKETEAHYHTVEMPRIRKAIEDFKAEMGAVGVCMTYRALFEQLEEVRDTIGRRHASYLRAVKGDEPYHVRAFIASDIPELEKKAAKLNDRMRFILNPPKEDHGMTPDMIDRAREYPIDRLVEVNRRGFALCVAHDDKNPSMFTRGNFAHCFACGYSGDSIDLCMRIHGLDFPEAVRRLQ
jgi:hypothetical protein